MASLHCNNQVRDSCFSNAYYGRRSCSKAQARLAKIIHLISTIPPPPENNFEKRGFDIDLNLRLGSFLDDNDESEEKSESLAENSFVGKNPDVEEEGTEEIQEKTATATDASSDVTEMQKSDELKSGTDGEVKTAATRFTDSLDLLIEAAELISERDKEVEKPDEFNGDVSPVVRSKRGRCQVLPQKFRDSVLEPWKKRPQRSTTTTTATAMVSNKKRRSR